MPSPAPYLSLPGNAREALTFYQSVFGGDLSLSTREEMGVPDEPGSAIQHGMLNGPVVLFASDALPGESPLAIEGLMFALLGAADPDTSRGWFTSLAEGGEVLDGLQQRPWGDWDGQVRDRFGVVWLIGFLDAMA